MISFDYYCDYCGEEKTSQEMESFICECGGSMRLKSASHVASFKPFYSSECKTHITSYNQMHKVYKKNGVVPMDDCKGLKQKSDFIRKNKEEIIRERYAKKGLNYKPGSNVRFDDRRNEFVKRSA